MALSLLQKNAIMQNVNAKARLVQAMMQVAMEKDAFKAFIP